MADRTAQARQRFLAKFLDHYEPEALGPKLFRFTLALSEQRSQIVFVLIGDQTVTVSSPFWKIKPLKLHRVMRGIVKFTDFGVIDTFGVLNLSNTSLGFDFEELKIMVSTISKMADQLELEFSGNKDRY